MYHARNACIQPEGNILPMNSTVTFKVKGNCKTTRPFRSRLGKRETIALFSGILVPVETSCAPLALAIAGGVWTGSIGAMSCLLLPWWPSVMTQCFLSSYTLHFLELYLPVSCRGGGEKIKHQRAERPRYPDIATELKVATRVQNSTRQPPRNLFLL